MLGLNGSLEEGDFVVVTGDDEIIEMEREESTVIPYIVFDLSFLPYRIVCAGDEDV